MNFYEYRIFLNNIIDRPSSKVLTYLYQPIVGVEAITIYKTLLEEGLILKELKNYKFKLNRLFVLIGLKEEEYFKNIKKLEAIGLLKTLINVKKEYYVFNLNSPLEPSLFFENETLNNHLYKKLGNYDYEVLRFIFRDDNKIITSESECVDISSSFTDVFDISNLGIDLSNKSFLKPKPSKLFTLNEKDLNDIINNLEKNGVTCELGKELMYSWLNEIFLLYKISKDLFIKLVVKAGLKVITKNNRTIINSLILTELKYKNNLLRNQLFDVNESMIEKRNIKVKEMETIKCDLYLKALINVDNLLTSQKDLLRELTMKYKLRDGVINCLLEFSYLKNEKIIVANYIYKIARSLNENNIKTAEEAMEYLIIAHKNSRVLKNNIKDSDALSINKEVKNMGYEIKVENDIKVDLSGWGDL
ncbi:chromosome replication initiation and membrane attachment protein [Spiroplasma corruscae]|uniref:Chromosome replication initiation and membrane attachment protein n=1 Tax=Spiroplasma corruscae TaxID=216934 RepID=A0A222EN54_9MOLU|nr:DnaD domain protein [Spiroplasma corruscae]ASP27937.1 chromosome replication initiation and membrane attachment protein [Spiroplasma corruscae]